MRKLKAVLFLVCALAGMSVMSAVINAASGSRADIQNAIDAASPGDIVSIPSGNWSVSGTVFLKEGIHVLGAGVNSTVLIKSDANDNPVFSITAISSTPFKISGIGFKGIGLDLFINDPNSTVIDRGVVILGKARFCIYDCRFERFTGYGIYVYGETDSNNTYPAGHSEGVVTNNDFRDIYFSTSSMSFGYGVGLYGDNSWPLLQLGTSAALFIENNTFTHIRHCIADNFGGRYVFRYNTVVDDYYPFAAIDAHGKNVGIHGSRSYEVYSNTVTNGVEWPSQIPHATWATGIRGGDGVIYNNTFAGMYRAMLIQIEGWNSNMTYPVPDQVRDLWVWGNTLDGIAYNNVNVGITAQDEYNLSPFLQEGRDFHSGTARAGYVPYVYPHPVSSLRGQWTLDNANSIQIDASASGNNGSKYGTPASLIGKCGNALDFNGSSDYIQIPYTAELNTAEFTVSAWAKIEGGSGTYRGMLCSRSSGGGCKGYNIYAGSDNKWQFWTGNGTNFQALSGPAVTSEWTHIAAIHTGTTNKLYVNGVEYSGTGFTLAVNSTQPFRIGSVDNVYYFNGLIDDVRYYSRVLSQAEIKAMYNRMPDPSFENALGTSWSIASGTPTLDTAVKYDGAQSVCFDKISSGSQTVSISPNTYIPVDGGKNYVVSVWAKGQNIVEGTNNWERFYVAGRWYDKNMTPITAYPYLYTQSGGGTFDWTKYESTFTAPSNAAYFRVYMAGMLNACSGKGWMDLIGFRPAAE